MIPAFVAYLRPVGLAAVVLSFMPVLLGIAAIAARRRTARSQRRPKRRPEQSRAALDAIRQMDAMTPGVRLEAFDRLDNLMRDHLTDLDIAAARSSTPDEIHSLLAARSDRSRADLAAAVLRECQRARYGGSAQLPDAPTLGLALDQTAEFLAKRVR